MACAKVHASLQRGGSLNTSLVDFLVECCLKQCTLSYVTSLKYLYIIYVDVDHVML